MGSVLNRQVRALAREGGNQMRVTYGGGGGRWGSNVAANRSKQPK